MNYLTVFSWDVSGTYHGIHESLVDLQEKKFREKHSLSKRKQTIVFESSSLTSIFASLKSSS